MHCKCQHLSFLTLPFHDHFGHYNHEMEWKKTLETNMIPNLFIYTTFHFKCCIFLLTHIWTHFLMFLKEVSYASSLDLFNQIYRKKLNNVFPILLFFKILLWCKVEFSVTWSFRKLYNILIYYQMLKSNGVQYLFYNLILFRTFRLLKMCM